MTRQNILAAVACILLVPSVAWAVNNTTGNFYAWEIMPYRFQLGDQPEMREVVDDQGYSRSSHLNLVASLNPDPLLEDALAEFGNGAGAGLFVSHGNGASVATEVYPYTQEGLNARNAAYTWLENNGYASVIQKSNILGAGWHIAIKYSGLDPYVQLDDGIVHMQCCYGSAYTGWISHGAAFACGPLDTCYITESELNVERFWEGLGGIRGKDKRSAGVAVLDCPQLHVIAGSVDSTTLTPAVYGWSGYSGMNIPSGGASVMIVFDSNTNEAFNPVDGNGIVLVQNYYWETPYRLGVTVFPYGIGSGELVIRGDIVASANCGELYLNGGSNVAIRLTHGINPAASVHGFSVVDGTARWKVGSEYTTDHYRIEAGQTADGPWETLTDHAAGAGYQSTNVANAPYYRLMEVETSGTELIQGIATPQTVTIVPKPERPSIPVLRAKIDSINVVRERSGYGDRERFTSTSAVFYTIGSLEDAVNEIAGYWSYWFGYDTEVVLVDAFPSDPEQFRQALKSDIASRAAGGTETFCIVGDANDHRQFIGAEYPELWTPSNGWETIRQGYLASGYGDQSVKDQIPTFYEPDTLPRGQNTPWLTPYAMGDLFYSDTDGDSIPNVLVTRLPFSDEWDVWEYAYKLQQYNDSWSSVGKVSFFVGDYNYAGTDGDEARAIADAVEELVPPSVNVGHVYMTDYLDARDRNQAAADHWNGNRPEVLFLVGSLSNRSWPACFFDQTIASQPWSMAMLEHYTNHYPVVVAASCDAADFSRTEDPDYGTPIAEKFLAEWNKGAIVWIGPTVGTWQAGNEAFAMILAEELFANPLRPLGTTFLIAQQRVLTEYAGQQEVIRTVRSYAFLGDPLVPFNHLKTFVGVEGSAPVFQTGLEPNTPNPFNPVTRISYSIARRGHIELGIYNIAGQLVCTLVNGDVDPGNYTVTWDGRNNSHGSASSGVYFSRLTTDGTSMSRRMVLLR